MKKTLLMVVALMCSFMCFAQVVDFEDLTLAPNSSWTGSADADGFESSYLKLYNDYDPTYGSWQGFAYTNTTDAETYDYTNLSAAAGHGVDNSANYAVACIGSDWMGGTYDPIPVSIKINTSLAGDFQGRGAYFCLPTYTSKYMDNEFTSYAVNHFFYKLKVAAYADGVSVGEREIVMADFTGENTYKMDDWTFVDLSWIANADSLTFIALSNDTGDYGINTPAYFCMDNFGAENTPTCVRDFKLVNVDAYFDAMGNLNLNSDSEMQEISIYDAVGRLVKSMSISGNTFSTAIENSGLLIVSVKTRNGVAVCKTMKF